MQTDVLNDSALKDLLNLVANRGIVNAAAGLGQMIGQRVTVDVPDVAVVPISSVPERVGGGDVLVVGIYLACDGAMGGHVMLILELDEALRLVDLLLGEPDGTTQVLDGLARSALAEAGNLTTAFFLNAVAGTLGLEGRPSPPAVIVDMAGAILDIMLVTAGELSDDILMMQAVFQGESRQVKLQFWMVPDLDPLTEYLKKIRS
jgi:chemotaxis protein CheC